MAELHAAKRNKLKGKQFAAPGERKLPVNDPAHARNAMARLNQTHGLSSEEKKAARRKILAAYKRFGIKHSEEEEEEKSMGTKTEELQNAHDEIDKSIETQEKSRLAKSLDALRARFGFGLTEDLSKANSSTMAGNDGYPQSAVNEGNISRARGKSKPAKHPDNNYENLPDAEQDTTDYENSEEDALDGFDGKKVTAKSKSLKNVDEEDFYKAIIDGDESGEVVEAINASDALELLASSMGKSIAEVSRASEAVGLFAAEQFEDLNKSLSVLAEAVGAIMETLEKSGPPAVPTTTTASADIKSEETRTTGEESTEEVTEKSMSPEQKKYRKTLEFLAEADKMNAPSYFSQITGEALQKSRGGRTEDNTPESLNTLAGRQRVKSAIMSLIKSDGLDADYLGALDYRPVSEVVSRMPKELRAKVGLD